MLKVIGQFELQYRDQAQGVLGSLLASSHAFPTEQSD